jgi:hypothetical protein
MEISKIAERIYACDSLIKKFVPLEGSLDDAFFSLLDGRQVMEN